MTINPKLPPLGPANIGRRAEPGLAPESDRKQRERVHSTWSSGDVEDTDLERRVLANERILQALIAHIAEADPKFIAHLNSVFSEPLLTGRREHDFTDTHAYADQFVCKVSQSVEGRGEHGAARKPASQPRRDFAQSNDVTDLSEGRSVTLLEVSQRVGIWEVTKDGRFYGHYYDDQPAFDAAEAAALAIVANGGQADLRWNRARPRSAVSDQAKDAASGNVSQIIEFRAGSTRIVRVLPPEA
jgi:hypothetical protein